MLARDNAVDYYHQGNDQGKHDHYNDLAAYLVVHIGTLPGTQDHPRYGTIGILHGDVISKIMTSAYGGRGKIDLRSGIYALRSLGRGLLPYDPLIGGYVRNGSGNYRGPIEDGVVKTRLCLHLVYDLGSDLGIPLVG